MELSQEIKAILNSDNVCQIATVNSQGAPNVASTWFLFKEGKIYIATTLNTVKAKNILSNRRVSLVFLAKESNYEQVLVQGEVSEIIDDSDMKICDEVSRKYIGAEFPRRNFPNRVAFQISINKARYHKVRLKPRDAI